MADHVLVPIDGSPLSKQAFEHALADHADADISVLYVIDPANAVYEAEGFGVTGAEQWYELAREQADRVLTEAAERGAEAGVDVTTATEVDRPARAILDYVAEHGVDHVVMGSHGRTGVVRVLLGSVAERVVRRAPVPVTVVREVDADPER
jgi:nucleotide-binding universal stress UspA family protein